MFELHHNILGQNNNRKQTLKDGKTTELLYVVATLTLNYQKESPKAD